MERLLGCTTNLLPPPLQVPQIHLSQFLLAAPIALGSKTDSDDPSKSGSQGLSSPSCQVHKLMYSSALLMTGWGMKGFGQ